MKFCLLCLFIGWPFLSRAQSTGCEPAGNLSGDVIYFSIKTANYYAGGKFAEVRLPYFYDSSFHNKNIEVVVNLSDGQKMTWSDGVFLLSEIRDSCMGTILEFNLEQLKAVEYNGKKLSPPRQATKYDIDFLIGKADCYWRLVPKK
jgi:hypothetical protein